MKRKFTNLINPYKLVYLLICILPLVWFGASYIEVISQNIAPNPTYSAWNIFALLF